MAPVNLKHVISFTSQDQKFPVENLLGGDSSKKWLSAAGDKSTQLEAVFQLEKSCVITHIDVGTWWTFSVEIQVGRSSWPQTRSLQTLLPSCIFMNPIECKQGKNKVGLRMFNTEQFSTDTRDESWDRVRVILSQPYRKDVQYGLSVLRLLATDNVLPQKPVVPTSCSSTGNGLVHRRMSGPGFSSSGAGLMSPFRQIQNNNSESVTLKTGKLDQILQGDLSRNAKLVKAAVSKTPKYKVTERSPEAERAEPRKQRKVMTFEEEVRRFLIKLDVKKLVQENENLEFCALRHRLEKQKQRKLSKAEKKLFLELTMEAVEECVSDEEPSNSESVPSDTRTVPGNMVDTSRKAHSVSSNAHSVPSDTLAGLGNVEGEPTNAHADAMVTYALHSNTEKSVDADCTGAVMNKHGGHKKSYRKESAFRKVSDISNELLCLDEEGEVSGKFVSPVDETKKTAVVNHADRIISRDASVLNCNKSMGFPCISVTGSSKKALLGSQGDNSNKISIQSKSLESKHCGTIVEHVTIDRGTALADKPGVYLMDNADNTKKLLSVTSNSEIPETKERSVARESTLQNTPSHGSRSNLNITGTKCPALYSPSQIEESSVTRGNSLQQPSKTLVPGRKDSKTSLNSSSEASIHQNGTGGMKRKYWFLSSDSESDLDFDLDLHMSLSPDSYKSPDSSQSKAHTPNSSSTAPCGNIETTALLRPTPKKENSFSETPSSQRECQPVEKYLTPSQRERPVKTPGQSNTQTQAHTPSQSKTETQVKTSSQSNTQTKGNILKETTPASNVPGLVERNSLESYSSPSRYITPNKGQSAKKLCLDPHSPLLNSKSTPGRMCSAPRSQTKVSVCQTIREKSPIEFQMASESTTKGGKTRRGHGARSMPKEMPSMSSTAVADISDSTNDNWLNTRNMDKMNEFDGSGTKICSRGGRTPGRGRGRTKVKVNTSVEIDQKIEQNGRQDSQRYETSDLYKPRHSHRRNNRQRNNLLNNSPTNQAYDASSQDEVEARQRSNNSASGRAKRAHSPPPQVNQIRTSQPDSVRVGDDTDVVNLVSPAASTEFVTCPICNGRFPTQRVTQHAATCGLFDDTSSDSDCSLTNYNPTATASPDFCQILDSTGETRQASAVSPVLNIQSQTVSQMSRPELGECPLCGKQFLLTELIVHADRCASLTD